MTEHNFAEIQRKHDEGDLTEVQARQCGRTHAAYGWAPRQYSHWKPELQEAYRSGHRAYKEARGSK